MAFVGEAILSSFFDTLFDKLSSVLIDYTRQVQVHDELNKWEKTLKKINAVLEDAEEKQMEEKVVKIWLDDLSDLAYDVEDILDDLATQALGRQLMVETQPSTSKFRSLIPSCCTSFTPSAIKFNVEMRTKIENITARETEKAAIVDSLLHYHEPSDDAVRVIAIIGMAGVGKTTLAQFAYNHDGVKSHFDLRVWVCVSDEFDVVGVTRTILQSVASTSRKSDAKDLNQLQVQLNDELSGKKFLLVLDDVWSQDCNKWNLLYKPMRTGAQGSRVIVTTRDQRVVPAVRASSAYPLEVLSNDDCLSLFAQHAFIHTRNFDNHPHLRAVGERIVKKCRGLPLAAKALGGMLRTQLNRDAWEEILGSKIWELPKENNSILPALKLSYHHLPSHLKCCFAYCSIFPKDYEFNVDELVLLWMGEGFLHQVNRKKQMEEIGTAYFHELLARSFFQQSNHHSSQFVMHDLIHDLAQLVAGDVCFNLEDKLENDDQHAISARARHSCFTRQEFEVVGKFEAFDKAKNLRTLIAVPITMPQDSFTLSGKISNQVLHNLIMPMRYLRVLSLTDYIMGELPCLIGIGKLKNLRHLDITRTSRLREMPFQFSNLTNLQVLTRFIVSKSRGVGIDELKNCSNLQGVLSISSLQESLVELEVLECPGLMCGLPKLASLRELTLKECDEAVLGGAQFDLPSLVTLSNGLQTLTRLEELEIWSCPKLESFPDSGFPPMLRRLELFYCEGLKSLPHNYSSCPLEVLTIECSPFLKCFPNGELPFTLKKLSITRCTNLDLRKLVINDCGGLECFPERGLSIPNLEYLKIEGCENLKSLTHQMRNLKSLRSLTISECLGLESFPKEGLAPNLASLGINNYMVSFPVKESRLLFSLTRLYIDGMESLASLALCNLISLRSLDISNCPNLWSLGPLPATLEELFISGCPTIEERYLKEGGEYWSNVAHIPCIYEGIQRYDIVDWMLDGIIDDLTFLDFNDSNFLI
ncbi:putative disease resistance RPP13-like protein 1 [Vitis vinifera]|uniref:Putative disease resistance RPP13-like protein 1 n=1 Tax=Vitis vinifera TaxID=29760 RepID=A0A438GDJ9_VITVI|nr:putative disease resistance RPP13-like protein 1 [Vitis vinifera]